jgi:lipoyl(octanoyl) transferase
MNRFEFIDLGVTGYLEAWERQREEARALVERPGLRDRVLFVEHPHVYTLGKSGDAANILEGAAEHAAVVRVDRGGDVTYHGPGQLVVYPVMNLTRAGVGPRAYVEALEGIVTRVVGRYGITGERLAGAAGVWLDVSGAAPRKICAIGIRCSRGVTTHGFALNVNTDLSFFSRINPCGFADKGVTSMARELGHAVPVEEVKAAVREEFEACWPVE